MHIVPFSKAAPIALAAALSVLSAGTALAAESKFAPVGGLGDITASTGNTSAPSNWRLDPSATFNGIANALDGTAYLEFDGAWACSGTLIASQWVLTAAHCAPETSMTVYFGLYNNTALEVRTVNVAESVVHPGWDGTLDTGADIALMKLDAPVTGLHIYNLSTTNDVGKEHLITGYGTAGVGSNTGSPNWNDGAYGHYGYNVFDVTSKVFNDAWDGSGNNTYGETYVVDFDPLSTITNASRYNTLQRVADLTGNQWSSDAGLGANEALIAGGDSGGADFVWNGTEWLVSGVHSWGWQFCGGRVSPSCDYRSGNSSSYGDISGSTAVFSHVDWINSVIDPVPEPGTYALMAMGLFAVGAAARRRRA